MEKDGWMKALPLNALEFVRLLNSPIYNLSFSMI